MSPDDPRHGTYNGYNNLGCRCDACRKANADKSRERGRRLGRRPAAELWREQRARTLHGTHTKYYKHGCRCIECREYARQHRARFREQARSRPIPDHVHGTVNGATNYLCRCEKCRAAERQAAARRRAS